MEQTMRGILLALIISLAPISTMADPHYGRYDSSHCLGSYVSRSDYQRLERQYRDLTRQLNRNLRTCSEDTAKLLRSHQQQMAQQSMMQASLQDANARSADALAALSEANGLPPDFFERPSKEEFDALQDRFDALVVAYRNLQRDMRALQQTETEGE
jgi:uncharacterized protein YukE